MKAKTPPKPRGAQPGAPSGTQAKGKTKKGKTGKAQPAGQTHNS